MPPKISVIVPVFNGERFIRYTIESVLSQTYQDWEIIVIDDGSTDNTSVVLEPYMDRIKYIWQEHQERSVARNKGVYHSSGSFLVFLDADDIILPNMLEYQVRFLNDKPDIDLVYSPCKKIDVEGNLLSDQMLGSHIYPAAEQIKQMILGNFIAIQGVMMRGEAFHEIGGFEPNISYGEDWSLWIRLLTAGYKIVHLPEVVAYYRLHERGNLPEPQTSEQILHYTLTMLERAKNEIKNDFGISQSIWNQVFAKQYGYCSLKQFALNQIKLGMQNFSNASRLDPEHWSKPDWLSNVIAEQSVTFSEGRDDIDPIEFVKDLFQYLPEELRNNKNLQRKTLAHTNIVYAFFKTQQISRSNPIKNIVRGLLLDPTWIRNRGVISIAIKNFSV